MFRVSSAARKPHLQSLGRRSSDKLSSASPSSSSLASSPDDATTTKAKAKARRSTSSVIRGTARSSPPQWQEAVSEFLRLNIESYRWPDPPAACKLVAVQETRSSSSALFVSVRTESMPPSLRVALFGALRRRQLLLTPDEFYATTIRAYTAALRCADQAALENGARMMRREGALSAVASSEKTTTTTTTTKQEKDASATTNSSSRSSSMLHGTMALARKGVACLESIVAGKKKWLPSSVWSPVSPFRARLSPAAARVLSLSHHQLAAATAKNNKSQQQHHHRLQAVEPVVPEIDAEMISPLVVAADIWGACIADGVTAAVEKKILPKATQVVVTMHQREKLLASPVESIVNNAATATRSNSTGDEKEEEKKNLHQALMSLVASAELFSTVLRTRSHLLFNLESLAHINHVSCRILDVMAAWLDVVAPRPSPPSLISRSGRSDHHKVRRGNGGDHHDDGATAAATQLQQLQHPTLFLVISTVYCDLTLRLSASLRSQSGSSSMLSSHLARALRLSQDSTRRSLMATMLLLPGTKKRRKGTAANNDDDDDDVAVRPYSLQWLRQRVDVTQRVQSLVLPLKLAAEWAVVMGGSGSMMMMLPNSLSSHDGGSTPTATSSSPLACFENAVAVVRQDQQMLLQRLRAKFDERVKQLGVIMSSLEQQKKKNKDGMTTKPDEKRKRHRMIHETKREIQRLEDFMRKLLRRDRRAAELLHRVVSRQEVRSGKMVIESMMITTTTPAKVTSSCNTSSNADADADADVDDGDEKNRTAGFQELKESLSRLPTKLSNLSQQLLDQQRRLRELSAAMSSSSSGSSFSWTWKFRKATLEAVSATEEENSSSSSSPAAGYSLARSVAIAKPVAAAVAVASPPSSGRGEDDDGGDANKKKTKKTLGCCSGIDLDIIRAGGDESTSSSSSSSSSSLTRYVFPVYQPSAAFGGRFVEDEEVFSVDDDNNNEASGSGHGADDTKTATATIAADADDIRRIRQQPWSRITPCIVENEMSSAAAAAAAAAAGSASPSHHRWLAAFHQSDIRRTLIDTRASSTSITHSAKLRLIFLKWLLQLVNYNESLRVAERNHRNEYHHQRQEEKCLRTNTSGDDGGIATAVTTALPREKNRGQFFIDFDDPLSSTTPLSMYVNDVILPQSSSSLLGRPAAAAAAAGGNNKTQQQGSMSDVQRQHTLSGFIRAAACSASPHHCTPPVSFGATPRTSIAPGGTSCRVVRLSKQHVLRRNGFIVVDITLPANSSSSSSAAAAAAAAASRSNNKTNNSNNGEDEKVNNLIKDILTDDASFSTETRMPSSVSNFAPSSSTERSSRSTHDDDDDGDNGNSCNEADHPHQQQQQQQQQQQHSLGGPSAIARRFGIEPRRAVLAEWSVVRRRTNHDEDDCDADRDVFLVPDAFRRLMEQLRPEH